MIKDSKSDGALTSVEQTSAPSVIESARAYIAKLRTHYPDEANWLPAVRHVPALIAECDRLVAALEKISAMQWEDRVTVSEATAWHHFQRQNRRIVALYAIADAALTDGAALATSKGQAPHSLPSPSPKEET